VKVYLIWTCGGGEPRVVAVALSQEAAESIAQRAATVHKCCSPYIEEMEVES
jgi:hypothetical protein